VQRAIERVDELVNRDPAIVRWGRRMSETFMVEVGDTQFLLTVRDGRIEKLEKGPFTQRSWSFAKASFGCCAVSTCDLRRSLRCR